MPRNRVNMKYRPRNDTSIPGRERRGKVGVREGVERKIQMERERGRESRERKNRQTPSIQLCGSESSLRTEN